MFNQSLLMLFPEPFADFVVDAFGSEAKFFVQYFGRGRVAEVVDAMNFSIAANQTFERYGQSCGQAVFGQGRREYAFLIVSWL